MPLPAVTTVCHLKLGDTWQQRWHTLPVTTVALLLSLISLTATTITAVNTVMAVRSCVNKMLSHARKTTTVHLFDNLKFNFFKFPHFSESQKCWPLNILKSFF
jgi:hypothetical protein